MPEPLDYRNPRRRDEEAPPAVKPKARAVIPIEFDTVLTRSQDHAAVRAVEIQLKRQGVAVFRCEDGDAAKRFIELHIRAAEFEAASQITGRIFARRQKLKSFPRQVVEPPRMPGEPDGRGFFL